MSKITAKPANKADQVAERREQLLGATVTVIARKGLSGITMNDIAVEAGCSYGVVAFHFKSKERLLLAALDMLVEEYEVLWAKILAPNTATVAQRLQLMIDLDFDKRIAKPKNLAVWMAFWAETSRVTAYRARCGELKRRSLASITELVAALAEAKQLDLPAAQIAFGLYALSDGCWTFNHVTGETGPAQREASRRLCYAYMAGFFPDEFTLPAL
ncbi:TetR family transcriptional regulator C-terminal domain-containing protein [Pseudomonas syringae]|uniref:TetR family transcriptional regulator C-terminal domain-containing protein n=1 Tax=Pseudomonas syringae TaxID=317 RepID=UPI001F3661BD|nr:TetR family transcriptional regulator C-terminal domain-containing protein [Pseudomonas syringae]